MPALQPPSSDDPSALYVTYDGAAEPLGLSQVVAYLERLSPPIALTLVSFEKRGDRRDEPRRRLTEAGVAWRARRYHRVPGVASTAWDVMVGTRVIRRELLRGHPDVVHVRSYVPALMATRAMSDAGPALLFDIRGFWADERVEGGMWRPNGALYRLAKRYERRFFERADAVVTLTHASVPWIRERTRSPEIPVRVIPTCTDTTRFANAAPRPNGPHVVWCGSLGTWYRFDLGVRLARATGLPFTVLTRQVGAARGQLGSVAADVRSVAPAELADELFPGDIGLALITTSFSKTASAPTRFAEYLAAGMPVAVTAIGDLAGIVESEGVGVVVRDEDDDSLRRAARDLVDMGADPMVRARCREVARLHFDIDGGVAQYAELYRELKERSATSLRA